jgi:hypothetical protein
MSSQLTTIDAVSQDAFLGQCDRAPRHRYFAEPDL